MAYHLLKTTKNSLTVSNVSNCKSKKIFLFFDKLKFSAYSPKCEACKNPIVPLKGETEALRIIALDKSYCRPCFVCEVRFAWSNDVSFAVRAWIPSHFCGGFEFVSFKRGLRQGLLIWLLENTLSIIVGNNFIVLTKLIVVQTARQINRPLWTINFIVLKKLVKKQFFYSEMQNAIDRQSRRRLLSRRQFSLLQELLLRSY